MIIHRYKLIVTPTRKVGGTSVAHALSPFFDSPNDREAYSMGVLSGTSYRPSLRVHGNWKADVQNGPYASYLKVLMVRNPFERLLSGYHFLNQRMLWGFHEPSFRDFVLNRDFYNPDTTSQDVRIWGHSWRPFHTMAFVDGTFAFDEIIRFENLESDFARICSLVGLGRLTLPFLNKTNYPSAEEEYDSELIEIVSDHFRDDLKFFGYQPPKHITN